MKSKNVLLLAMLLILCIAISGGIFTWILRNNTEILNARLYNLENNTLIELSEHYEKYNMLYTKIIKLEHTYSDDFTEEIKKLTYGFNKTRTQVNFIYRLIGHIKIAKEDINQLIIELNKTKKQLKILQDTYDKKPIQK